MSHSGGRFDFEDGGTYCGGWEDGKAHGQGICTGKNGQGEYAGSWNHGYEVLGVYTWPSGSLYEGNWSEGKRHNLGVETKGKWQYKGEWLHGLKGRYGVRISTKSRAKYEGTWNGDLQDGYGTETYADGGTYQGQWMGGMRHGSGIRQSVPYGMASVNRSALRTSLSSLKSEQSNGLAGSINDAGFETPVGSRGGFVLTPHPITTSSLSLSSRKNRFFRNSNVRKSFMSGLKLRSKSNSSLISATSVNSSRSVMTTGTLASTTSDYNSLYEDSDLAPPMEEGGDIIDLNTLETYYGHWKNDKRCGYGVCKRTDGFAYEGQWLDNQRNGYGLTTFSDGSKEEGKYKNNLVVNGAKRNFSLKSGKIKSKVAHAVEQAQKAKEIAIQKADIAESRTSHSIAKAIQAESVAQNAREEAKLARCVARDLDPQFHQPGLEYLRHRGEDVPTKEDLAVASYMTETERTDVVGPEGYHQYSNRSQESALRSSSISQRLRASEDAITNENHKKEPISNHYLDSSLKINVTSGGNGKPESEDRTRNQMSKQLTSMQYLSPDMVTKSARDTYSNRPTDLRLNQESNHRRKISTISKASLTQDGKTDTANAQNIANSSPRHKKSFFGSLRIRSKKHSNAKDSKFSQPNTPNAERRGNCAVDGVGYNGHQQASADDRRKMWKKSKSVPNSVSGSFSRSQDFASFEYQNNEENYLTGYEIEMSSQNDQRNFLFDEQHLQPQNSYDFMTSPELFTGLKVPSNFTAVDNNRNLSISIDDPLRTTSRLMATDLNHNSTEKEATTDHQRDCSSSNSPVLPQTSLSMSALRPRTATNESKTSQVPPPIPAFANYSSPVSAEDIAQTTKNSNHNRERLRETRNIEHVFQDGTYEDEYHSYIHPHLTADVSRSPLPGNLRQRIARQSSKPEDDVREFEQESDSTKTWVTILVLLLISGFLALFLLFLR